jgi:hypothetical protein
VIHLERKGVSARATHEDLAPTLGHDAVASRTVTYYLGETRCPPSIDASIPLQISHVPDDGNEVIVTALYAALVALVPQLARLTHTSAAKVFRRITVSLGFTARHLRWAPHLLLDAQKQERAERGRLLLRQLTSQQRRAWHDIVTLDDSLSYLTISHELIWLPETEKVPERERPPI